MILNEIAKEIGVLKYDLVPEGMHKYYPVPRERKAHLCSAELIDHLQERFDFFGEYHQAVRDAWLELEKNERMKAYVDAACLYMMDNEYEMVTKIKIPEFDGTPVKDFFALYIHLPSIDGAYEKYLQRGFDAETVKLYMKNYYNCLANAEKGVPGRPALTRTFFSWQCLYTKARLFRHGGFNFEVHRHGDANILKNKVTGEVVPVAIPQKISANGMVFGSVGETDEEGAFEATFEETEDAYVGYPAKGCRYVNEKTVFPKSEWVMLMKPGDNFIAVHIPRGSDISVEAFRAAREGAKKIIKQGFSEYDPKMFHCYSWLLSKDLEPMLKPDSKILAFGNTWIRYPQKDASGKSVFSFVFPATFNGPYEDLPEDTSLMRALKKHYIEGKVVLSYAGVIEL
ncbi:MAG: hypothetical protein IKJ74_07450 [Clostridia bacterium]|nr:hypothetical protein [Clostridia bacterium]